MKEYRHEIKYEINSFQIENIRNLISEILCIDNHLNPTKKQDFYTVRSLYFDDYENSCYYENENGVDDRKKIRIRLYNGSTDFIKLEEKSKIRSMTKKISCSIDSEMVTKILNDELSFGENSNPLLNKLYIKKETELLSPKVIVEYDRIPYIYEDGNVRITFDKNIRFSNELETFLDNNINCQTIMPDGLHIMEVKYDELLPDFIYKIINGEKLKQISYSKYYLCRKFGGI